MTGRDCAPSVSVIIRLVRAILIPQITYCFPLLHIDLITLHKITQIISTPLRKTLGLGSHASAARTLWECGIPGIDTILLQHTIAAANRSHRAIGNASLAEVPPMLAFDISHFNFHSYKPSRKFTFLPYRFHRFSGKNLFPPLPIGKSDLKRIINSAAKAEFSSTPKLSADAISLKADLLPELYLSHDPKPIVSIRARCRLGVALTPKQLFKYKKRASPLCESCHVVGDLKHVLMDCTRFNVARLACAKALSWLYVPIPLDLNLILGLAPFLPPRFADEKKFQVLIHEQCLDHTGKFLAAISRQQFL